MESSKRNLKVLIVEDLYDDMELAAGMIQRNFPEVEIYKTGNKQDTWKILLSHDIDLLLLDIKLPDGSGFDITREIREYPQYRFLHIVFITGQNHDPLDTYNKYHCYSFIAKPYTEEHFIGQLKPLISLMEEEIAEGRKPVRNKVKSFNTMEGDRIIPLDDILYAEISLRKVTLHTMQGIIVLHGYTLKKLKEYLDDPDFVLCHQSFLVNTANMIGIETGKRKVPFVLFKSNDNGCLVSQRMLSEMKKILKNKAVQGEG